MESPAGFPQLPPEGSPSLRRQKPDARNQTFGLISHFLGQTKMVLHVLHGEVEKHGFENKKPKDNQKYNKNKTCKEIAFIPVME